MSGFEAIGSGSRIWLDPEPDLDNEVELQVEDDYHDGAVSAYLTIEQAHALGNALLAVKGDLGCGSVGGENR